MSIRPEQLVANTYSAVLMIREAATIIARELRIKLQSTARPGYS